TPFIVEILPSFVGGFVAENEGLKGGFTGDWLWGSERLKGIGLGLAGNVEWMNSMFKNKDIGESPCGFLGNNTTLGFANFGP
nr:hypothetical protein [Tanacetum cinerariifolium]